MYKDVMSMVKMILFSPKKLKLRKLKLKLRNIYWSKKPAKILNSDPSVYSATY